MKKRCLAAALALVLLAALLPIPAGAADSDFTISNGMLTKYRGSGGKVTIPSGVTSIGNSAFNGCSTVTSVSIPSSVTSIGNYAFFNCTKLASISLPNNVTSIGTSAFWGCSSLLSVTLPSRLTSISDFTFAYCTNLVTVDVPSSVTSIGPYAFTDCKSLTQIDLPSRLTLIGKSAFASCTSLTSVTIPGGVVTPGESAFNGCSRLSSVTLQEGVSNISPSMFANCSSLRSISIPDTVTSIGTYAFQNCKALAEVTLPYGLTSIPYCAFYYSGLASLTVPETVTYIDGGAFDGCSNLTRIVIPRNTRIYEGYSTNTSVFSYANSLTIYGYTGSSAESHCKTFNIPFVPIDTEITFRLVTPVSFKEGQDVLLQGTVTSKYSVLRYIKAEIFCVESNGNHQLKQKASDNISNVYSYDIDGMSWLNYTLNFSQLDPGRYYVRYTATTRDNTTKSEETEVFTITLDYCKRNGHTDSDDFRYTTSHPHHRMAKCSVCGVEFDAGLMADWTEWEVVRYATCTEGELSRRTCTLASQGCTVAEEREEEPLGHAFMPLSGFQQEVPSYSTPASCTTPGGIHDWCYRCRAYIITPLPAIGHIYALDHADESETVYTCAMCDDSVTRPRGTVGTAQEGHLVLRPFSLYHLNWSVSADGLVQVDFGDPPPGTLGIIIPVDVELNGQSAWVACYGEDGNLLDVKILDKDNLTAQIDPTTPLVKVFWLGGNQKPMAQSEIVWAP